MTTATGYIHNLESKAWHGVESVAIAHPNTARLLSIAMAIGTFVKDIFFPLIKCIESTILAVKRYTDCSKEIDHVKKQELNKVFKSYSGEAIKNLIKIPFSPLVGICEGVYALVRMLANPVTMAKIEAAQADLDTHFASDSSRQDAGLAFGKKAALERFSARMKALEKPEDIAAAHFMQTEEERNSALEEVRVKREKYNQGIQAMKDHPLDLGRGEKAQKIFVKEIAQRIEAFAAFEIELRDADLDKAKAMHFDLSALPPVVIEEADKANAAAAQGTNTAVPNANDATAVPA